MNEARTATQASAPAEARPKTPPPDAAAIDKEIDRLFRAHGDPVLTALQERGRLQAADAEELLHEIFLVRVKRFLERGRVIAPGKERSFLTRVASFAAASFKMSRRSDRNVTGLEIPEAADAASPTPSAAMNHQELVGGAQGALNALPADLRWVVELRMAGKTFSEIADELGIEEEAAQKRYKKGIGAIRSKMGMIWSSLVPKGSRADLPETRSEILKALDLLGTKYATALIARHARGMDLKFIAATLGMPLADAETLFERAEELLEIRFGITGDELAALLEQLK